LLQAAPQLKRARRRFGTRAARRRFFGDPGSEGEETMSRGKMKGDDSAQSKRGEARGSGGTTKKSQNAGKQHNNKADNTKTNRQ
jgi:hypothetical protein